MGEAFHTERGPCCTKKIDGMGSSSPGATYHEGSARLTICLLLLAGVTLRNVLAFRLPITFVPLHQINGEIVFCNSKHSWNN